MIGKLKYYFFSIFCHFLEVIFSAITFKKLKKKMLFSSDGGLKYEGNSRYYFEWLVENDDNEASYWVTRDKELFNKLSLIFSDRVLYYYSLKFVWAYITSSILFNTHSHTGNDINKFCSFNFFIVNLWHGVPLKNMPIIKSKRYLKLVLVKRTCDFWLIMTEKERKIFSNVYSLPDHVFFKGLYPRLEFLKDSKKNLGKSPKKKNILFMPTFRSEDSNYYLKYGFFLDENMMDMLCFFLENKSLYCKIKYHPYTKGTEVFVGTDRVKYVSNESVESLLFNADVLITDYSSVAFDFSALGKKVIFFVPDLEIYKERRGIDKDFYDYLLEYGVFDWPSVFKRVDDSAFENTTLFNLNSELLPNINLIHEEVINRSNVY